MPTKKKPTRSAADLLFPGLDAFQDAPRRADPPPAPRRSPYQPSAKVVPDLQAELAAARAAVDAKPAPAIPAIGRGSISQGRPRGEVTGLLSRGIRGALSAVGASEASAQQAADSFEQANYDWNPLAQADMLGTQVGRVAAGQGGDRSALVQGALATGINAAVPVLGKPIAKAVAGSRLGKYLAGSAPAPVIDDALDGVASKVTKALPDNTPPIQGLLDDGGPNRVRGLNVHDDGRRIKATHFSDLPDLEVADPSMIGSARSRRGGRGTSRGELSRATPRTYYGARVGEAGGYRPEFPAGTPQYEADLPAGRILNQGSTAWDDLATMGRGIRDRVKTERTRYTPNIPPADAKYPYDPDGVGIMETLAREHGYAGIRYPESQLGDVVYGFEEQPLRRVNPEPVAPTGPEDFLPDSLTGVSKRDDWALLTAENPYGQPLGAAENEARNSALMREIEALGYQATPARGRYGGNDENSYLVSGLTGDQASGLGRLFDQDSVLTNRGFLYNDGTRTPINGFSAVDGAADDGFTEITLPDGRTTRFAADVPNWDDRFPDESSPSLLNGMGSREVRQVAKASDDFQYAPAPDARQGAALAPQEPPTIMAEGPLWSEPLPEGRMTPAEFRRLVSERTRGRSKAPVPQP